MQTPSIVAQASGIFIRYIGRDETCFDHLYGTGTWTRREVKLVVPAVALRMVRHPDQYEEVVALENELPAERAPVGEPERRADKDPDTPEQEAIMSIQQMDAGQVKDFVERNYQQKLDGRKGVAALRSEAVRLVEQFGILI